ncbi:MAG: cob(I)yrinic acid a,c-diamide adenosyltransferase [Patescibacteria group bacterium]
MSPIYTRKGDSGETGLGNNARVSKTNPRIEAVGTLDELNASLGLALSLLPVGSKTRAVIEPIQHELFVLGSHVAVPASDEAYQKLPALPTHAPEQFEVAIDKWWQQLPPLTEFILPGGTPAAAALHAARTVARRAERRVILLRRYNPDVTDFMVVYLNRLSDLLFAAARFVNFELGKTETIWKKTE